MMERSKGQLDLEGMRPMGRARARNWDKAFRVDVDDLRQFNTATITADPETGKPEVEDLANGVLNFERFEDFAEWLLNKPGIVLCYADGPILHSLFKLIDDPTAIMRIANAPHGTPTRVGEYLVSCPGGENTILVRRGNDYGHLCNLAPTFPDDVIREINPTVIRMWADLLGRVLADEGIDRIGYPNSIGSVARDMVSQRITLPNLVKWVRRDSEALLHLQRAWECHKGPRMEALLLGYIPHAWGYDFSSAYPSIARDLPSCDPFLCQWLDASEYQLSAFYGFLRVRFNVPDMPISPITYRRAAAGVDDQLKIGFPIGQGECFMEKCEYDLALEMGCDLEIIEGSWGIPLETVYPFRDAMDTLYRVRSNDRHISVFGKKTANAIIGNLSSFTSRVVTGPTGYRARAATPSATWNPIYAAKIYAMMRAKALRFALEEVGIANLVAITIDGVISLRKLGIGPERIPGQAREEYEGSFFLANDYLKDRPEPGLAERDYPWLNAVRSTGQDLTFQWRQPIHGTLGLFRIDHLSPADAYDLLGTVIPHEITFRLGSAYRKLPTGVTYQDFLAGPVPTSPMTVEELQGAADIAVNAVNPITGYSPDDILEDIVNG